MLKIIIDQLENINIHHENGEIEVIPAYQSDDLYQVLQGYNINTVVELHELGNVTTHTVAELLELS